MLLWDVAGNQEGPVPDRSVMWDLIGLQTYALANTQSSVLGRIRGISDAGIWHLDDASLTPLINDRFLLKIRTVETENVAACCVLFREGPAVERDVRVLN